MWSLRYRPPTAACRADEKPQVEGLWGSRERTAQRPSSGRIQRHEIDPLLSVSAGQRVYPEVPRQGSNLRTRLRRACTCVPRLAVRAGRTLIRGQTGRELTRHSFGGAQGNLYLFVSQGLRKRHVPGAVRLRAGRPCGRSRLSAAAGYLLARPGGGAYQSRHLSVISYRPSPYLAVSAGTSMPRSVSA